MPTPAFTVKIIVPRRRAEIVRRARLLDALSLGEEGTVTVVRAPAGYGKTTLLVDLCHETHADVCWLALDEWDQDPAVLLQYLRLSLSIALQDSDPSKRPARVRTDTRLALEDLARLFNSHSRETWLVLDDFHTIEQSASVVKLVDEFTRRLPANCRLFILSRTRPALASLPKLRLVGSLIELDARELAFTRDEVRTYFEARGIQAVPREMTNRILELTEGWPAAVTLLGDADLDPSTRPGTLTDVSDYLSAEVFSRLSSEQQSFLLKTSVLETLDPEACAAVLGLEARQADEILVTLPKLNIPITPLAQTGPIVKLHPVMKDFLVSRLRREDPQQYKVLQRRAGNYYSGSGRIREAVWHLGQSEDWDSVVELVLAEAPNAYNLGQWQTLMSWLNLIPLEELRRRPRLRLLEARILSRLGQTDASLRVITDTLADETLTDSVRAEFEASRAANLRVKGEVSAALGSARRSFELAVIGNAQLEVVTEARKELGLALVGVGSFSEAIEELRFALQMCIKRGDTEATAFLHGCLGSALGSVGDLAEAVSHLEQARQKWRQVGNSKELSWVLNNLGMAYWNMGQEELARELFVECIARAREGGNRRAEAYALDSLADIHRQCGSLAESAGMYQEVLDLAAELGEMTLSTLALTGLADLERQQGYLLNAERLARQALAAAQERGGEYEEALARLTLGRAEHSRGDHLGAVKSLVPAQELLERAGAKKELAECLLFLADALIPLRSGRPRLRRALERIPVLVEAIGHDSFLVRHVSRTPALLQYAISRRISTAFYRQLLRKCRASEETGAPASTSRAPALELPTVNVVALGSIDVTLGERHVLSTQWESEKSRELFLLLLTTGRALRRDEIASYLWPDTDRSRSVSAFHSTIHRVRNALYPECIVELGRMYRLNPSGVFECDVTRFQALLKKVRGARSEESHRLMSDAISVYAGPFAPSLDSEWADGLRRQLEETFVEIAGRLAGNLFQDGEYLKAIEIYQRILASDPLNEPACYRALKCHLALGNQEAAATMYRRFRALLDAELGQQPSPAVERLSEEIIQASAGAN
jgi:LuxR family maltose regulon positive regulatory protein